MLGQIFFVCLDSFVVYIVCVIVPRKPDMCLTPSCIRGVGEIKDLSFEGRVVGNLKVNFFCGSISIGKDARIFGFAQ